MLTLEPITLDNYDVALSRGGPDSMLDSLISSFAIAIPATVLPLLFAALAAYEFAFIQFRGRHRCLKLRHDAPGEIQCQLRDSIDKSLIDRLLFRSKRDQFPLYVCR